MANPTCTKTSLITNTPFLSANALNPKQQMAWKIWFMVKELKQIGGTDYTVGNLVSPLSGVDPVSLLYEAKQVFQTMDLAQRAQAELAIYYNNAVASGASIASDPDDIAVSVSKLVQGATEDQLQTMYLSALCQLGFHKTRPQ